MAGFPGHDPEIRAKRQGVLKVLNREGDVHPLTTRRHSRGLKAIHQPKRITKIRPVKKMRRMKLSR